MPRNTLCLLAFSAAILAMPSISHADCAKDMDQLETSFDNRLKNERSELTSHPLVLEMKDGSLVDMRGTETNAKPTERWFVTDKDAVESIRSGIEDARRAYAQGETEKCETVRDDLQARVTPRSAD